VLLKDLATLFSYEISRDDMNKQQVSYLCSEWKMRVFCITQCPTQGA